MQSIGGRKELAVTLLRMFVERCPQQLKTLRDAIDLKDVANAELVAHTLKGSAGQLRATQLPSHAAEIEAAVRAQDWTKVNSCMPAFEIACTQLSNEFTFYLQNSSNE